MFWIDVLIGVALTAFMLMMCIILFPDDSESVKEIDD